MEKIWLQNYPPLVAETVDPDQYLSLPAALDDFCFTYADKAAFVNYGASLTYRELAEGSRNLAAYFQQRMALQPGDRVALMMPNCLQYPLIIFAALRAGLIVVNINPLYTAAELKYELQDSGATAMVVLSNFAHLVQEVLPETSLQQVMVTGLADLFPLLKRTAFTVGMKLIPKLIPAWNLPRAHSFRSALKLGGQLIFNPPVLQPDQTAFLQYTGGTTGVPKGAMLSHRNLVANVLQCTAWVRSKLQPGAEILLTALPLYHIFSMMVSGFTFLALGGTCVLVTEPRNVAGLSRCWRRTRPTVFIGLNTLFLHLMQNKRFQKTNFKSLKLTVSGGMATLSTVAEQWQQLTQCVVTEGYGLTEASPVVAINALNITYFNGSIGLPVPGTDVKVCDNQGQELRVDEIGELLVKGPQVMKGYWQKPEATAEVLDPQGWLKTGDMVRIDAGGFLYLMDRKKDMIIVSGFNVYPREVEAVIAAHAGVAEVAVVGEANPATGETVTAWVVKSDPNLTAEEITQYCRQQLTAYKIPKKIEFMAQLPKSRLGKVLHRKLRDPEPPRAAL